MKYFTTTYIMIQIFSLPMRTNINWKYYLRTKSKASCYCGNQQSDVMYLLHVSKCFRMTLTANDITCRSFLKKEYLFKITGKRRKSMQ